MSTEISELRAWWDEARGQRLAPRYGAFDPVAHVRLLPKMLMVRTADRLGDFRFTVYGTDLGEQFGEERTGVRFDDLQRFDNFDEVMQAYWQVYTEVRPHHLVDRTVSPDRDFIAYERLLLPLLADEPDEPDDGGERPSHIVGVITFSYAGA